MTAAEAAYRLWLAEEARAAKIAELAAWTIPAPTLPTGYVDAAAYLTGDGATDDTAALQALLDTFSGGETLFFPTGTYRIDGPITIDTALALVGETGTVFDCSAATAYVFTLNADGSLGSQMAGMSITGITIEGPGIETTPLMVDAYYLDGFHVSHSKIHNAGYAGIRLTGCADTLVEDSIFDNIMLATLGYGVAIYENNDDTVIRRNFFLTNGRHGVTIGCYGNEAPKDRWSRAVTVEDNYFEDLVDAAIDSHYGMYGPYMIRDNVISNCHYAVKIRGDEIGATITRNVSLGGTWGIWFNLTDFVYEDTDLHPGAHVITDNLIECDCRFGLMNEIGSMIVDGNIFLGPNFLDFAIAYEGDFDPPTFEVTNNIYTSTHPWFSFCQAGTPTTVETGNVFLSSSPIAAGPAAFRASPAVAVTGETVSFTDATPGTPPDWAWDFGDGSGSAAQHPAHVYPTPGVYPVTLAAGYGTTAQTITVVPGVSYGGARLSEADLGPLDHDPVANATDLHSGRVGLQGSPVSRRAWTINALADDRAEIEALAALKGQHLTLNLNGAEYPGVMIRPPMLEVQLTPSAWAYQIGFVQETRR